MFRKYGLAAALLLAGAVPAFADDTCQAPPVPAAVDGSTATTDQVKAAIAAYNTYSKSADTYVQCITDYVTAQNAQADKDKKSHDQTMIQSEGDKANAVSDAKVKAGNNLNTAIGLYKKAHPG